MPPAALLPYNRKDEGLSREGCFCWRMCAIQGGDRSPGESVVKDYPVFRAKGITSAPLRLLTAALMSSARVVTYLSVMVTDECPR